MKMLYLLILLTYPICIIGFKSPAKVMNLQLGSTTTYNSHQTQGFFSSDLRTYCYEGVPKSLSHLFQSLNLELDIDNDDFVLYEGKSPDDVQLHYENQRSLFSFNFLNTNKRKQIKLNPFNQTCVGIDTPHSYTIRLNIVRIDFWKVNLLLIGVIAFVTAKRLSETPLFYYLTGILLGICASFLVVVYFLSKLFPKKPMMYGVMVGGWTLGMYFAQLLWENIQMIVVTYQSYVFWYIVATGFISFIICYRLGPPTNQRSKNIIQWSLQVGAVGMVYCSSHYKESVVGFIILMLLAFYFPRSWLIKAKGIWLRKFPPKRRLLTNEEYYEQSVRETTKALHDLKNYCNSPESKPWKVMLKLKNPQRFASFIEGSPHLIDEEVLEYETFRVDSIDISDDSDESIEYEQPIQNNNPKKNQANQSNGHHSSMNFHQKQTSTPIDGDRNVRRRNLAQVEFSEDDD